MGDSEFMMRSFKEGLHSFAYKDTVSVERMEKIKKHPHAMKYFRFLATKDETQFHWFGRTNVNNTSYK